MLYKIRLDIAGDKPSGEGPEEISRFLEAEVVEAGSLNEAYQLGERRAAKVNRELNGVWLVSEDEE